MTTEGVHTFLRSEIIPYFLPARQYEINAKKNLTKDSKVLIWEKAKHIMTKKRGRLVMIQRQINQSAQRRC